MFIEPKISFTDNNNEAGWIEVISGCMFSGKTEELIRRLRRAIIAGQEVAIFKPSIDERYDEYNVVSHDNTKIPSTAVEKAEEILPLATNCKVVGIDEAQFFDKKIVNIVNKLANSGKRVIVAGLDMDFEGNPFGSMPQLLAIAEYVTKVHAICARTGKLASFSFRLSGESQKILIGEKNIYEPRSRDAFIRGLQDRKS